MPAAATTALDIRLPLLVILAQTFSGEYIRKTLEHEGIDTTALFIDPAGTSRSVNLIYQNGQRKNCYDGKSHMSLRPPLDSCEQTFRGARLAHFNIPNWARTLLPAAKKNGLKIACDIQDVVNVDDPYRLDFIRAADYLFFSAANYPDPTPLIQHYLSLNPALTVVCGMGAKGCALGTSQDIRFFPAH